MRNNRTIRSRKSHTALLLVCCVLTVINLNLIQTSAHDDDTGQFIGGLVAVVAGLGLAAASATVLNPINFATGVGTMCLGIYCLVPL